ncbi:TPA: radical SAM protein [Bacillus toyonensis]|nr:radical SAM protein [Bacillus toyonensis]
MKPLIEKVNNQKLEYQNINFDKYIVHNPLVNINRFHLSSPVIAFIEITNLCNLRCKHCYADSAFKRPNEMSTEAILKLIDELADMGVLQVFLTGGEVFSHPDAVKIINYARTKPFLTQVFTNGLLITEEKLASITSGTSFFISFDTAVPERTIRGGMSFPKLQQRFEWMKEYGHSLRTAVSVHRYNIKDVEGIFEWCIQNNFPRPQWLETHPIGRALLHPDLMLKIEDIEEVFDAYKQCMDKFSENPFEEDFLSDKEKEDLYVVQTIKFCQSLERATNQEKCGRSLVYINSAGEVYPCSNCMSNSMYKAGNLENFSFKEIWTNGFRDFREITFDQYEICNNCDINKEDIWCQFRCPPLSHNVSKNIKGCGATDYLKIFMMKTHKYWADREKQNIKLTMRKKKIL